MAAAERLARIQVRVARARTQARELETLVSTFHSETPYRIKTRRDPNSRRLIYYVDSVREAPFELAAVTGDVLQNLRSALDHLAHDLVLVGTGGKGPVNHTYFPVSDDALRFKKETPVKVKGMTAAAIARITALQPWRGGNDSLWRLHKLNNIHKHRLLLTVGSAFRSVDIGAVVTRQMLENSASRPERFRHVSFPTVPLFLKPSDRQFPLRPGNELFVDLPDAEEDPRMRFQLELAVSEPGIVDGEPLADIVKETLTLVENILPEFSQDLE